MRKEDLSGIRLLGKRLLVEEIESESSTPSGIILPAYVDVGGLVRARVVKVGEGEYNDFGVWQTPPFSEGDVVWFPKMHGAEFLGYWMIYADAVEVVEQRGS